MFYNLDSWPGSLGLEILLPLSYLVYFHGIICSLALKGGLSDSELRGVADDVQKAEKLADLADSLETVPLLKSLEGDTDAPFKLLQRWRRVENTLEAHSLLVHHLRCIGLTETSDK